jgi:hypothetical protein
MQACRVTLLGAGVAWAMAMIACTRAPEPPALSVSTVAYAPGLGEIMSLQQMRHVKLWLAGQARNWKLASYEVDELDEGFSDAVRLHPTHKDAPVAIRDVVPRMTTGPLGDLRKAIDEQDAPAFALAFDELTTACNGCHVATNFAFNRVQRPASNPYPDQIFDAPSR